MIGLLLIGIVLSYAFLRTGTLYLSIGLHAGWIISIKTVRVFGDYRRESLGWLFGSTDPKIVSGVRDSGSASSLWALPSIGSPVTVRASASRMRP